MIKLSFITVLLFCVAVSGCGSRTEYVSDKINEIKHAPSKPIASPPVMLPVAPYTYSAQNMRSPFMPPSLERDINHMAGRTVVPDFNRPKQELEKYSLEQLTMKGTLMSGKGPIYGLIDVPHKGILKVQVGNYIGTNFGKIIAISPSEINVVEIVPNGSDGYVERPRSLIMVSSAK